MTDDPGVSRRGLIAAGSSLLVLAGCGNLIEPDNPPGQIYMLSPTLPVLPRQAGLTWQLSVARPEASAAIGTDRVAIERNQTIDYYANAQWTDAVPQLVQALLVEALEKGGAMGAVAAESEGIRTDYILQSAVNAFEARYGQGDAAPMVVVDITAKIVTAAHGDIVGAKTFHEEAPAAANSIPAAVTAFGAALSTLLPEVAQWVMDTAPPPHR